MISIITPTFNRAQYLPTVFKSLQAQTCYDFEWLVIDDGSIDDTRTVILELINNKHDFPIRYQKKQNGGKHTAINVGVQLAVGDLIIILDSDDSLPADSVATVVGYEKMCMDLPECGGFCGLMAHHDGTLIGTGFPENMIYANSIDLRYIYKVKGDLMEIFKTSALRDFVFPVISGERFCPEALVWNRIATQYKLICVNKVVYFRDYLEGGLTDKIVKIRMDSPRASMMTYQELTKYDIPFIDKLKAAVNYWRFRFCAKGDNTPSIDYKWYFAIPLGYLMHLKDIKTTKL